VAIISEMIHTASLVHDDILDHAETRFVRTWLDFDNVCLIESFSLVKVTFNKV